MRTLARLWRWFTLADVLVTRSSLIDRDACDRCDDRATCRITVNSRTWHTCSAHFETVLAELGGGR